MFGYPPLNSILTSSCLATAYYSWSVQLGVVRSSSVLPLPTTTGQYSLVLSGVPLSCHCILQLVSTAWCSQEFLCPATAYYSWSVQLGVVRSFSVLPLPTTAGLYSLMWSTVPLSYHSILQLVLQLGVVNSSSVLPQHATAGFTA